MDDKTKNDIASLIVGIIKKNKNKWFMEECEDDIKRLVVECIDTARNALISTKKTMEDAALEKFRKRFENEIEPALTRMSGRMAELISKGEFDNELEKMAREELIYALRRRAEEWAKKVASSEVRFKFDEIYD